MVFVFSLIVILAFPLTNASGVQAQSTKTNGIENPGGGGSGCAMDIYYSASDAREAADLVGDVEGVGYVASVLSVLAKGWVAPVAMSSYVYGVSNTAGFLERAAHRGTGAYVCYREIPQSSYDVVSKTYSYF